MGALTQVTGGATGGVTQVIADRALRRVTSRARPSLGSVSGLLTEPGSPYDATTGPQR
ncbi:hypothetical protein BJZ21_003585 [Nocardioides panaciterrulae]|uniref:Uncharacterized protein n=1 Tax=Nocardioides panaciterrulae TaxID=661492 RepID=A0A7Y9E9J2_9ACTN|nr:hypothetical protein [Nocardioides panaciterrulae]